MTFELQYTDTKSNAREMCIRDSRCSPRYGKPFVTIDLGSIPEQLFESELFGFEKGADRKSVV